MTIGIDQAAAYIGTGYGEIQLVGDWILTWDPGDGQPGENILVDDSPGGAWFALPNLTNVEPDSNQRVLQSIHHRRNSEWVFGHPISSPWFGEQYQLRFDFDTTLLSDGPNSGAVCGCTNAESLNYDPEATVDNGTCLQPGCTYPEACNYDAGADFDDGSCSYPEFGLDCDGQCVVDTDGDGICEVIDMCIGSKTNAACNGPGAIYECGCFAWPEGVRL